MFLSLRDQIAAAAMQGLLAGSPAGPAQTFGEYAEESYKMADAMLLVRARAYRKSDAKRGVSDTKSLSPDERSALREAAEAFEQNDDDPGCDRIAKAIRGVLARGL